MMNSKEIESNVKQIFENFSKDEFIYDLLVAYGISKTSITRLKKGDFNLSKIDGEILYKKKIIFKEDTSNQLLSSIESLSSEERIIKHSPRFAIITDFETLVAKDLKLGKNLDIALKDLPKYYDFFLPLAGNEVYYTLNNNEADRDAAYKMAQLYDNLITANLDIYNSKQSIHKLNIFLSRLLFCYFAEDTGIFDEESIFTNTLVQHTVSDGTDVHEFLNELFHRLNTVETDKFPSYLVRFPYVNGGLFRDSIESPHFTAKARKILIELGELNWKEINPDIFGSMIQAVVLPEYRSDLGMHYTSVENILKLIKPLFLDALYEEFDKYSTNEKELKNLIQRISKIKFFDSACGSGNFLIITYKEVRKLEIEILKRTIELTNNDLLVESQISLEQFYGIEIDDFAHEMAILSLWLAEHQMNKYFEEQLEGFSEPKSIIPLKNSNTIILGNATRLNWLDVCPATQNDEIYIIGNPPYLGARRQDVEQKKDMDLVFATLKKYRDLDYISCWFYKGAKYISGLNAKCAFVTTNSICQGQQVSLIWPHILAGNIEIDFAHQSFKWTNNAKGKAGVSVIIVGIRNCSNGLKYIYHNNFRKLARNINPYIMDSNNIFVKERNTPLAKLPEMKFGNMPNDGGGLILTEDEKNELISNDKNSIKFLRPLIGSQEFINGEKRYCLWIEDNQLNEALDIPFISKRIEKTKIHRINSKDKGTKELAKRSHQFRDRNVASENLLIIPSVSSERREYIPCGYLSSDNIISNSSQVIYDAEPYIFSVINSRMHMVWVKAVGGKLETRYRYSKDICYNTFPFPDINAKQKENLNLYVFAILDERAKYPEKTMSQLYDPEKMPLGLKQAHRELDEAIEKCYRLQPFTTDTERLEYLFKQYEEMVTKDTLYAKIKKKRK